MRELPQTPLPNCNSRGRVFNPNGAEKNCDQCGVNENRARLGLEPYQ